MDLQGVSVLVAFGAGVLSFLSPCVLPLVPAYLGHLAGVSVADKRPAVVAVVAHALVFVAGFSLVFVAVWASVGLVGYLVRDLTPYLRQIGGALLILMGLHVAGLLPLPILYREWRFRWDLGGGKGYPGSFLVGVLFAAGWTPCVGPVLAAIIGLASLSETVWEGTYLLASYSIGLGVPFLAAAALLGAGAGRLPTLGRYGRWISGLSGVLLIGVGILMLTNTFARVQQYVSWWAL